MLSQAKFILSKSKVVEQYALAKQLADTVSYSLKTNYEVGSVLEKETDSMFSIHYIRSLPTIKDKSRIWFLSQAWNTQELDTLFEAKVNKFIVDNEEDLQRLLTYIEDKEVTIELLLRIRLKENTVQTGKYFVFGMKAAAINKLLPELRQNKKISKLGIHFHRKTQNVSEWSLKDELQDTIAKESWQCIDIVNIGGGLPAEYKNFQKEVLESIFSKIKELREWLNSQNIEMIIEPGRFIAAAPIRLETTIQAIYDNTIIVDCSVYNSALDTFVASIKLLVEGELPEGEGNAFVVKGNTPCSMDLFRYKVYLNNPQVGEKLVFLNAGAYNFWSNFCRLEELETVIVD